jgi:signal transduction histidine kinase
MKKHPTVALAERSRPIEQRVAEAQGWFLVRILIGRLLVLGGVILAVSFLQSVYLPAFQVFVAISFLTLIPYSLWLRRHAWQDRAVSLQFLVDIAVTSGLIHFSGGINSPFFVLYPLIILAAGLVCSRGMAVKMTVLSALSYSLLLVLEAQDILVYHGEQGAPYMTVSDVAVAAMVRIFLFAFFGAASAYLSRFTDYQTRQIRGYASLVETIVDHIPVGIFAVLEDGNIAMANKAAAALAGRGSISLAGSPFNSIFSKGESGDFTGDGIVRASLPGIGGSEPVPVMCVCSQTSVPDGFFTAAAVPASLRFKDSSDTAAPVTIWAVRDIRAELEAERSRNELTRLRTTVQVATELAHHVRNTLTAISGAAYLMKMTVTDGCNLNRPLMESDRNRMQKMNDIVDSESARLEARISEVLFRAEAEPSLFSNEAAALYEKYVKNIGSEIEALEAEPSCSGNE